MRQNILQFGSSRSLHVSSISMNMTRIKYIPKKNLVHLLTTPHLKVKKPSLECWSISNSVTSFINRNATQDLAPDSLSFSHLSFASAMSTALSAAPRSSWSPRTHGRLENETTSRIFKDDELPLFVWGVRARRCCGMSSILQNPLGPGQAVEPGTFKHMVAVVQLLREADYAVFLRILKLLSHGWSIDTNH